VRLSRSAARRTAVAVLAAVSIAVLGAPAANAAVAPRQAVAATTTAEATQPYDFDVEFGLGGVTFIERGSVDPATCNISSTLSARIPIVGTFQLANLNGNLVDGVTSTFGISGVLSGTIKDYYNNGYLTADITATIFGSAYGPTTIKLLPLPFSCGTASGA